MLKLCVYFFYFLFFSNTTFANTCEEVVGQSTTSANAFKEMLSILDRAKFAIYRDLSGYDRNLYRPTQNDMSKGPKLHNNSFSQRLKNLPSGSLWLDVGSGSGRAIQNVLDSEDYAHLSEVISMSYNARSDLLFRRWTGRLKVFNGLLEDVVVSQSFQPYLGQVDKISDVYGAGTYSPNIADTLNTYLKIIRVGGDIEMIFPVSTSSDIEALRPLISHFEMFSPDRPAPVALEDISKDIIHSWNAYNLYLDQVTDHMIERQILTEVHINSWLLSGYGYQVEGAQLVSVNHDALQLIIRKTKENARVPPLQLVQYKGKVTPPFRSYLWLGPDISSGRLLYQAYSVNR